MDPEVSPDVPVLHHAPSMRGGKVRSILRCPDDDSFLSPQSAKLPFRDLYTSGVRFSTRRGGAPASSHTAPSTPDQEAMAAGSLALGPGDQLTPVATPRTSNAKPPMKLKELQEAHVP
eukprot:EG_transcript_22672